MIASTTDHWMSCHLKQIRSQRVAKIEKMKFLVKLTKKLDEN